MHYREFYSELGKLLYAVSNISGGISEKERKALHEIVRKELVPAERHKDKYGTDTAFYAEIEFEFLEEEHIEPEEAFNSFLDFIELHHTAFDERMRKLCIHVANEISESYNGTNEKENALIEKLKKKIRKIERQEKKS